jgi:hypothetical protein
VRGILNDLPLPLPNMPPLTAWITPPVVEKATGPRAYVWGGRLRAARQTAPRGPGMQKFPWTVDIWLVYLDTPDNARQNEPFPLIIDTVITAVQKTVMPLFIDKDGNPVGPNATSGTDTQIQSIGETFDLDYPPERLPASMRMVWYSARIGLDVLEVVQA